MTMLPQRRFWIPIPIPIMSQFGSTAEVERKVEVEAEVRKVDAGGGIKVASHWRFRMPVLIISHSGSAVKLEVELRWREEVVETVGVN